MYLSFAAFIFAMSGCSNETFEEGYGRTGNDILLLRYHPSNHELIWMGYL